MSIAGQIDKLIHKTDTPLSHAHSHIQYQFIVCSGIPSPFKVNGKVKAPHWVTIIKGIIHDHPAKYHTAAPMTRGIPNLLNAFGA